MGDHERDVEEEKKKKGGGFTTKADVCKQWSRIPSRQSSTRAARASGTSSSRSAWTSSSGVCCDKLTLLQLHTHTQSSHRRPARTPQPSKIMRDPPAPPPGRRPYRLSIPMHAQKDQVVLGSKSHPSMDLLQGSKKPRKQEMVRPWQSLLVPPGGRQSRLDHDIHIYTPGSGRRAGRHKRGWAVLELRAA